MKKTRTIRIMTKDEYENKKPKVLTGAALKRKLCYQKKKGNKPLGSPKIKND